VKDSIGRLAVSVTAAGEIYVIVEGTHEGMIAEVSGIGADEAESIAREMDAYTK
jgi:hypothetical protein